MTSNRRPRFRVNRSVSRQSVLDVGGKLLERDVGAREATVLGHAGQRSVHVVRRVDVVVVVRSGVERDVEARLVDEVHARLERVADAPQARHVPGEVVAELPLLLLGRLRGVDVLAHEDAVGERLGRVGAVGGDEVGEVGVLEDELVQPEVPTTSVVQVDRVEGVLARSPIPKEACWGRRRRAASSRCGRIAPRGSSSRSGCS